MSTNDKKDRLEKLTTLLSLGIVGLTAWSSRKSDELSDQIIRVKIENKGKPRVEIVLIGIAFLINLFTACVLWRTVKLTNESEKITRQNYIDQKQLATFNASHGFVEQYMSLSQNFRAEVENNKNYSGLDFYRALWITNNNLFDTWLKGFVTDDDYSAILIRHKREYEDNVENIKGVSYQQGYQLQKWAERQMEKDAIFYDFMDIVFSIKNDRIIEQYPETIEKHRESKRLKYVLNLVRSKRKQGPTEPLIEIPSQKSLRSTKSSVSP